MKFLSRNVSKYHKVGHKSGENKSINPIQLLQTTCVQAAFLLSLNSVIQIISGICLVAIIVLCGVVIMIEKFFLTLEYYDSARPGIRKMFCRGPEL